MDFLKYFKNDKYEIDKSDCWTFVQEVYKDEHGVELPNHPILTTKEQIADGLIKSNVPHKLVKKAEKGCIIYYRNGDIHHAGYAIDETKFIHKTKKRVEISTIPEKALIYKVIND